MQQSKAALRAAVRKLRTPALLAAEDPLRLHHFLSFLPAIPGVLATYASLPGEPGTHGLIDAVVARGWEVRLPVLRREPEWARFEGWEAMRPGWRGIPEPTGARLGPGSLAEVDVIVVSCLQVDLDGFRLGVGGGWYDRALPARRAGAAVVAWTRDCEVVEHLPREPFDLPVDHWCTESGMYRRR